MCESVKVQLYRRLQWTGHAWHSRHEDAMRRWGILPLPGRGARRRRAGRRTRNCFRLCGCSGIQEHPGGQAWLLYGCDPDALLKELATRGLEPLRQQVVVIPLVQEREGGLRCSIQLRLHLLPRAVRRKVLW